MLRLLWVREVGGWRRAAHAARAARAEAGLPRSGGVRAPGRARCQAAAIGATFTTRLPVRAPVRASEPAVPQASAPCPPTRRDGQPQWERAASSRACFSAGPVWPSMAAVPLRSEPCRLFFNARLEVVPYLSTASFAAHAMCSPCSRGNKIHLVSFQFLRLTREALNASVRQERSHPRSALQPGLSGQDERHTCQGRDQLEGLLGNILRLHCGTTSNVMRWLTVIKM